MNTHESSVNMITISSIFPALEIDVFLSNQVFCNLIIMTFLHLQACMRFQRCSFACSDHFIVMQEVFLMMIPNCSVFLSLCQVGRQVSGNLFWFSLSACLPSLILPSKAKSLLTLSLPLVFQFPSRNLQLTVLLS